MLDNGKIFPDDKIRVMLANIPGPHITEIPDTEIFHMVLYEAKEEYPDMFKEFGFHTSGTFPYSELLERVIMRMRIAKVDFAKSSKKYVRDNIEPKFTPDELAILKSVARKLMGDNACTYMGCNLWVDCRKCDGYLDGCHAYVPDWFFSDDR